MAYKINYKHSATGVTIYATIENAASEIWNASALVTMVTANWATYGVALTETPAGGYRFVANWPGGITAVDLYILRFYLQAGGSEAITDTLLDERRLIWDGSAESLGILIDVDSTATETVRASKALEILLGGEIGKATFNTSTRQWAIKGRDGTTPLATVTLDTPGNRTASSIP